MTNIPGRLAGKALGDFLKVAGSVLSQDVEQGVLNRLTSKYGPKVEGGVYPPASGMEIVNKPGYPEYGIKTSIPEAADTRIGKLVNKLGPEKIAKLAGAAAPPLALGGTALGLGLIGNMMQPRENVYAQSAYSLPVQSRGTPVSYANQAYVPGMSALTNAQAGEALLEQQKFQHQLELIQARQTASTSGGSLSLGNTLQGYMEASHRALNAPAPHYG